MPGPDRLGAGCAMRVMITLWRRELSAYFAAPLAYAVWFFFLLLMGVGFFWLLQVRALEPTDTGAWRPLMGPHPHLWLGLLILVPVITMRSFAEERRSGSLETLLTAPVTEWQVVAAKFAGAVTFYMVCWSPTVFHVWLLTRIGAVPFPLDYRVLGATYVGILLLGLFYLALGLLASALTRHQAVAALMTVVVLGGLFLAGFTPYYVRTSWIREAGHYVSAVRHMTEFSRGVVDTRPLVFYLSGTWVALFAVVKVIEARKWSG